MPVKRIKIDIMGLRALREVCTVEEAQALVDALAARPTKLIYVVFGVGIPLDGGLRRFLEERGRKVDAGKVGPDGAPIYDYAAFEEDLMDYAEAAGAEAVIDVAVDDDKWFVALI
jgi:hypothetical protein